jgi:endo-1,4-beta-xylanase
MRSKIAALAAVLLASTAVKAEPAPTLKDAYKGDFLVGAALSSKYFDERDPKGAALVAEQFNTISPENVMKWEVVNPQPGVLDFTAADRYVEWGEKHHMAVIGHNLVWHSQTPAWVFQDEHGGPISKEALAQRLHDHIFAEAGRYKGHIYSWDVVNEVVEEDGSLRKSKWLEILGPEYIALAFVWAHQADPQAKLYYNDYNLENPAKRAGALELVKQLKAHGVPIDGVGLQDHNRLEWPTLEQEEETITAFGKLGVKVSITELDIDVLPSAFKSASADVSRNAAASTELNPYAAGLPPAVQQQLADRYAGLFKVFLKHKDVVERVTLWGVTDADSWLNGWPVRGRSSYPLLFDRDGKPKPAFLDVVKAAETARP